MNTYSLLLLKTGGIQEALIVPQLFQQALKVEKWVKYFGIASQCVSLILWRLSWKNWWEMASLWPFLYESCFHPAGAPGLHCLWQPQMQPSLLFTTHHPSQLAPFPSPELRNRCHTSDFTNRCHQLSLSLTFTFYDHTLPPPAAIAHKKLPEPSSLL